MTKTYPALDYKEEVTVIGITEEPPATATEIGTIKIGDTGFSTNCGWDVVIEKAKTEARKAGGNVLKITEHIPPSMMGSSCDRITAKIFKVGNPQDLTNLKSKNTSVVDSTWDYAKLSLLTDKKRIINRTPHFQFVCEGYFETTKTTSP